MPKAQEDKYDLLAEVIGAIYDENQKVTIETVHKGSSYDDEVTIPTDEGLLNRWGPHSENWARAQSVKIGQISMRRIPVEKARASEKKKDNRVYDYNCVYIVRMPDGREAEFLGNDSDFVQVWYAVLGRYDAEHIDKSRYDAVMSNVVKVLYNSVKRNPKLAAAAGKGVVKKDKKSNYDKAMEQLNSLGIDAPKRFMAMQRNKQND